MPSDLARRLAMTVHRHQVEPNGAWELDHVARVAQSVMPEARNVAWLHDALERSTLGLEDLAIAGFTPAEVEAVALLTRSDNGDFEDEYLAHVEAIARAPGRAGRLARAVKAADLADRIEHPRRRENGWAPPYADALDLLESGVNPSELRPLSHRDREWGPRTENFAA